MKCYNCGGEFKRFKGIVKSEDKYIGEYIIDNADYFKCDNCGEEAYPAETLNMLSQARKKRIEEFLKKMPLGDFVTASEAAKLLGISKQALHKNKQIKNKVYYVKIGDQKLFHKKSIMLFKEKKDGRFKLIGEYEITEKKIDKPYVMDFYDKLSLEKNYKINEKVALTEYVCINSVVMAKNDFPVYIGGTHE